MAVLNIKESFITENKSIYDFLNQPERGLYILSIKDNIAGVMII